MTTTNACSCCGSRGLRPVFELRAIPVLVCTLWPDRESARACPRGDIVLEHCPACGLIENHAFQEERVVYGEGYENSLHFSEFFQGYLRDLARDLVREHGLEGQRVAEIGCGDGEFLEQLCRAGAGEGLGFDPSYPPGLPDTLHEGRVRVVRDYFRPEPGCLDADAVVCRQVLEHVPDPRAFVEDVKAALRPGARPVVVFEVPNTTYTLDRVSLWDVIYEHRTYFTKGSLARVFTAAGFDVTAAAETYESQYVAVTARPAEGPGRISIPVDGPEEIRAAVDRFASRAHERIRGWRDRLAALHADGKRVALWGAGARGVNFLNIADPEGVVEVAVDLNERKHGLHLAGTGQAVRPPAHLAEFRPDVVVITNPVYQEEIARDLRALGLDPEVALA